MKVRKRISCQEEEIERWRVRFSLGFMPAFRVVDRAFYALQI